MDVQPITSKLLEVSNLCLGIPYEFGSEVTGMVSRNNLPKKLDCSEYTEWVYKVVIQEMALNWRLLPDGAIYQYKFCIPVEEPQPGDLVFLSRKKDPAQVYHVGMLYDSKYIIEARAFDGRDWTGKVTKREKKFWEEYVNFAGYRRHPDLMSAYAI